MDYTKLIIIHIQQLQKKPSSNIYLNDNNHFYNLITSHQLVKINRYFYLGIECNLSSR